MSAFLRDYAELYDVIYRAKDYPAEARFALDLIARFGPATRPLRILDLACGTGRHAIEFARAGASVAGADVSEAMLARATSNAQAAKVAIAFHRRSFLECGTIGGPFDAVVSLFASIGYLLRDDEIRAALRMIRSRLAPGGVFILDFWNASAVESGHSPEKRAVFTDGDREITRVSRTTFDAATKTALVMFDLGIAEPGFEARSFAEEHRVRAFEVTEMTEFLAAEGLPVVAAMPFLDSTRPPRDEDWYVTLVGRRSA